MRILYTVLNGRMGGGQAICRQIMEAARVRGDSVRLVTPSAGELSDALARSGIPVDVLPLDRTFQLHGALRLARLLRRHRIELVHCHAFIAGAILARVAGRLAGVPVICHLHAHPTYSARQPVRSLQLLLERATSAFATYVAVSHCVVDSFRHEGVEFGRAHVIPNAIAIEPDRSAAAPHESGGRVVGYVGRLSRQKGLEDLLAAFQQVATRVPDAMLAIAGEDQEQGGAYRRRLEREAERLGIAGRTRFLGFRADVREWMRGLDVFVLPSHMEAFPVTILEAMAAAKPVVAADVGGVPEIVVDRETGLLVPPRNPERLADAIARLLSDPAAATAMGRAGRRRVEQEFAADRWLERIWTVYREVLNGGSQRRV